jgi:Reverse transcriptase (RNA-dependent DNA polymerase)
MDHGFPIEFFQTYWSTVSEDLFRAVTKFYHNQLHLWRLNHAFITLIPKKNDSVNLHDFRPISVLAAILKIITKILVIRLQPHMATLINPLQTAFIKGRQLMQSFLSTREMITHLSRNRIPSEKC